MANKTSNTSPLTDTFSSLPQVVQTYCDKSMDEISNHTKTQLNTALELIDESCKLTRCNIDSVSATARVAMDGLDELSKSTGRMYRLALNNWLDMSRNLAATPEQIAQRINAYNSGAMTEQAAVIGKAWLKTTQDITRQVIKPLVAPVVAEAVTSKSEEAAQPNSG